MRLTFKPQRSHEHASFYNNSGSVERRDKPVQQRENLQESETSETVRLANGSQLDACMHRRVRT